ncbi:hypothetical protein ACH5RR_026409 [Cinchona calisaya]|uniref:Uncharacterized protein n=1 Tax=Cinchona calisaya TaxID=153742 RepID=A0ABD2Z6F9_9GENT
MEHRERHNSMDQQGTTKQWVNKLQTLEKDQIQWVLDWTKWQALGLEQHILIEDDTSMFILPEVKGPCPMRQQMQMAWRQLKFRDNKRELGDRFIPVSNPSYMEWVAKQYALKPVYDQGKASVDLGSLREEVEQWKSKVGILEIKLRRTEKTLKQSQEAEDKVKRSNH